MAKDLTDFWLRFQSGIDVAVGSDMPDKLAGVRDGFLRFFQEGMEKQVPVAVVPQAQNEGETPLPWTDSDILNLARLRALKLEQKLGDAYRFYVGSEAGLLSFSAGGQERYFVRSWTVVRGLNDETWGSSGSVQLPMDLVGESNAEDLSYTVPGRRRSGGMVSSLTGNLENNRSATALSTFHAVSTLMYGLIEKRPPRRRSRL